MGTRALTEEQVDDLAAHLIGTAKSLGNGLEELFGITENELDIKDCHSIDERLFYCAQCDWCCGMDELNTETGDDEMICDECAD
jgi:hypothetical protein